MLGRHRGCGFCGQVVQLDGRDARVEAADHFHRDLSLQDKLAGLRFTSICFAHPMAD